MNLFPFHIAVEAMGWCFVALALTRARAKPKCPAASTGEPRKDGIIVTALVLSTLATICFAVAGNGLASMLAFAAYSLAWLRFEAWHDAKKALADERRRSLVRR